MSGVLLQLLVYAGLIALEAPGLLKTGRRRELIAFLLYLAVAAGLTLPQGLGVQIPNPMKPIAVLFQPLSRWLE
ncbi:MAG: hypothetical protein ACPLPT_05025 [Moorellales bacterium]